MALFKRFFEKRRKQRELDLEAELQDEVLWDEEYFWQEERANQANRSSQEEQEDVQEEEWDWDSITDERTYLKMSDPYQREKYIRSLVEQVKDASNELDKLSYEYNVVTAALKDMDELEALPLAEKNRVTEYAKKVLYLEKETEDYEKKKSKMPESQFYKMEQYDDSAAKIYDEMKKTEKYREMIRDDLSRLDSEKQAYSYRRGELAHGIENSKGMVFICLIAMGLLFVMLFIMQMTFKMEVSIGYMLTVLVGSVSVTVIYLKYQEQKKELLRVEKNRNRIILLQNTVKIRYVNNVNLLDYLYLKYGVSNSKEWKHLCDMYEAEKRARAQNEQNEEEMEYYQGELLKILRCYQLSDARVWIRHPVALYDHKEMVEIRHEHIVRRQKLRAQMDYNRKLAKEGEKLLKEFIKDNPSYSNEILGMMERYS